MTAAYCTQYQFSKDLKQAQNVLQKLSNEDLQLEESHPRKHPALKEKYIQ